MPYCRPFCKCHKPPRHILQLPDSPTFYIISYSLLRCEHNKHPPPLLPRLSALLTFGQNSIQVQLGGANAKIARERVIQMANKIGNETTKKQNKKKNKTKKTKVRLLLSSCFLSYSFSLTNLRDGFSLKKKSVFR